MSIYPTMLIVGFNVEVHASLASSINLLTSCILCFQASIEIPPFNFSESKVWDEF